jgi:oligosaccharyl transferase (archaeosortase A-associated)
MDRGKRSEPAELLAVVLIGLLLKLFAGRNSLTENGIILPGYDEYYHMRRILYTATHFPEPLWFDSYLNYPHGLEITWPPLFDQVSAAFCLILGQHSKGGVEMAASLVPVLMGVAAIVAVYFLVRELFDRKVALLAAFMTALAPYYLLYTMLAATDHHCLEILLQLLSLLLVTLAITRREKRFVFATLAGLIMAALAYTWQGADIYLGIFLIYAAAKLCLDLKDDLSSQETITTLLAAFCLALLLVLPFRSDSWMSRSFLGLAGMIIALVVMYILSHLLMQKKAPWMVFPAALLALVLLFVLLSSLLGGFFGLSAMVQTGFSYIWGGNLIGKISEAEPLIYSEKGLIEVIFSSLGLNLLFSLAGIAALITIIRHNEGRKRDGQLLLLVWAVFTIVLTLGQSRFLYISTISIGVLISILFFSLHLADRKLTRAQKSILLLFLILPTMVDTISFAVNSSPALDTDWQQSLQWLKENSNKTSFYDFPYESPQYSVMSWWDYGNWILFLAERPVVTNNFQAGLMDAAKFYLSESEEEAVAVLDAHGSRYVFVNYDLLFGKLPALAAWADEDIDSYVKLVNSGSQVRAVPQARLFNTTLARLYLYDGAGMNHFRLIYESPTLMGENPARRKEVKIFEYNCS